MHFLFELQTSQETDRSYLVKLLLSGLFCYITTDTFKPYKRQKKQYTGIHNLDNQTQHKTPLVQTHTHYTGNHRTASRLRSDDMGQTFSFYSIGRSLSIDFSAHPSHTTATLALPLFSLYFSFTHTHVPPSVRRVQT